MISGAQPETNKIELRRSSKLEARILLNPAGKLLGQAHMLANVVLQTFDPVMPDYKPKLKRTKTAAELDVPVAIIDHCTGCRCLIAQILRQHRQRLNQVFPVGNVENIAIKIGEHPFVRIKCIAIGELCTIIEETEFRTERCGATHC